jgi:hypothetical protein
MDLKEQIRVEVSQGYGGDVQKDLRSLLETLDVEEEIKPLDIDVKRNLGEIKKRIDPKFKVEVVEEEAAAEPE